MRLGMSVILMLGVTIGLGCGARPAKPPRLSHPEQEIMWVGQGGGFRHWDCSGRFMYALSVEPEVLDVWEWGSGTLTRKHSIEPESSLITEWLDGDRYLVEPIGVDAIKMMSALDGRLIRQWEIESKWYADCAGRSGNGRWVAICLVEDSDAVGHDWEKPRIQIVLVDTVENKVKFLSKLRGETQGTPQIRSLACSDDGRYVAAASWNWGAVLLGAVEDRKLWEKRPPGEAGSQAVAFSPDNETLYVGGTQGCVYGMDVKTGDIVSSWFATQTGREEYGHRINCVAISPDGRFVAAGTGPEGEVYVWWRATGEPVGIFLHGLGAVEMVMFSPDSQRLASFVPGTIKIWKMPK